MSGRTKLPINDWQKEQRELVVERYALCDEYYSLKEEVKSVEVIRRGIENIIRSGRRGLHHVHTKDIAL